MIGVGFTASMISLPVISYCKQATFFSGGHAPSAMFGVKVNIAFGGSLCVFVTPHLVDVIGVGFMGSMISLPVINYYEHTTFIGGHAHSAVKGNTASLCVFSTPHLVDRTLSSCSCRTLQAEAHAD